MKSVLTFLAGGALAVSALAQTVEINSFDHNGSVTWSAPSNAACSVEWASTLVPTANWQRTWIWQLDIQSRGGVSTSAVPMFYRIVAWTNGLFLPAPIGGTRVYSASNGIGQVWTQEIAIAGILEVPGMSNRYVQAFRSETYGGSPPQDAYGNAMLFFRSTDKACYGLEWLNQEGLAWQDAPIGTSWSNVQNGILTVIEANETVTVPAGTFQNCLKFRKSDFAGSPGKTWYEWVKPGFFLVKIVDYNVSNPSAAPVVYELKSWTEK